MNYEDMSVLDAQACRKWFNANRLPDNMERIFAECWSAALASRPAITMPEWISVNDRLPEYAHDVIVAFDDGIGVYMAEFRDGRWFLCGHNEPDFQTITHWMFIPDAPSDANNGEAGK